jgi:hypothetical protein
VFPMIPDAAKRTAVAAARETRMRFMGLLSTLVR